MIRESRADTLGGYKVTVMRNFRRLSGLVGVALVGCLGASVVAQNPGGSFGVGLGVLSAEGKRTALPYTVTALGVLVALQPIVDTLGGELVVGPLKQSHTLKLFGERIILGPDSAVITVGEEIVPLSRQPMLGAAGELEVPLDFLEHSYGDLPPPIRRIHQGWLLCLLLFCLLWKRSLRTLVISSASAF